MIFAPGKVGLQHTSNNLNPALKLRYFIDLIYIQINIFPKLMLSIRPKSQAGRCAKHSFNQMSELHVEAQSSKLNACSINVVSLSKINHCVELKFQVQSDKSQTSNLIQKHAPSLSQLPCFPEGEGAAPREPALPPLHPLRPRGKHGG